MIPSADVLSDEERGLKWRPMGAVRNIPIPPELVGILRDHRCEYPVADDELLFTNEAGQPVARSRYAWVFLAAKRRVFAEGDRLLASTPYDLRHANATLLLNAGVPIGEVARPLGHSPDMLLRIYAGVMHEAEATANEQVEKLLGWYEQRR